MSDEHEVPAPPSGDAQETTWTTPGPTVPVPRRPTVPEPHQLTPPPVAPSWTSPTVAYPTAAPPLSSYPPPAMPGQHAQSPHGQPTYGPPVYGAGAQLPGVAGWGAVPLAPKPGVIPLRPLSVGEILDGAITYIRRDPKTVLGISAAIALTLALLNFVVLQALSASVSSISDGSASDSEAIAGLLQVFGATVAESVVTFVLNVLAVGLLTSVMGQAVLGRRVTTSQAWARASKRFWPLLGLTLLVSLAVGAVAVVGVGLAILVGWGVGSATDVGLGVFLGFVLVAVAVAVTVWLYVRLLLAPVALILEDTGVLTSMRRSAALVTGAWWRTFGIYLLGSILAAIVGQVLSVPFSVVGGIASLGGLDPTDTSLPVGYSIATSLGLLVSTLVVLPFTAGIVTLLYVDRRIRREALDIELARAARVGV